MPVLSAPHRSTAALTSSCRIVSGLCTKEWVSRRSPPICIVTSRGVEASAKEIGIEHFGAHDLRRTCAKLCRKNGGDLEQIKFLLGHSSIQTTERYLGSEQEIVIAVNDNLGL
jgi:integrase